jgi:acetolactate synthase-1/2/3 large subunit
MAKVSGGEAIVQSLIAHGVDTVFGLPGVQNDHLFNAFYDNRDKLRVVHSRHEQGVAYMALGYALATGKVGVCSVVPGPGFLNATAALATAYSTNAKVLCLVGQIQSDSINKGYGLLHEIPNQIEILRTLTKWADRIETPADAPTLVAEAFRQLNSGRPRPVGLECAPDVLAQKSEVDLTKVDYTLRHPPVDMDKINEAADLLAKAENPLIFIGLGAIDAAPAVQELAELLQAPVVSGRSGHGVLSSRHPLSIRTTAGHQLWEKADVVVTLGSRLTRPMMGWGTDDKLKIIRVDIDPEEHYRVKPPTVGFVARCEEVTPALVSALKQRGVSRPSRTAEMEDIQAELEPRIAAVEPQVAFLKAMRAVLPDDGYFVDDLTQVGYVSRTELPIYEPRTYISPGYQGTLGWSYATALGVKVAHPEKEVLSISGDGGFMFNVQELSTAVKHKINLVHVIFNDGAFGNVQRMQKKDHGGRVIASDLDNPDFVKLAEAFGALGLRAHSPDELQAAIQQGFDAQRPTLIDVPVGEMPAPWSLYFLPRNRPAKG